MKNEPKRGIRPSVVTIVLAVAVVAAVVARGLSAGWWSKTESSPAAASSAKPVPFYPIPSFARPEEAERYFDAMIQGDTRAIELLDQALAKAKMQPDADSAHIQKLESLRTERTTRLAAHLAARPSPVASK